MDEKDEYEDLLKVKALVWEVKEGKPTKLKALGITFVAEGESIIKAKKPEQESLEVYPKGEEKIYELTEVGKKLKQKQKELEISSEAKDRGDKIARLGTNNVFENVLADVKDGISKNEEIKQLLARIAPYYPDNKPSSHGVYLSVHRRYLDGERSKSNKHETGKDKGEKVASEMGVPIFTKVLEEIKSCGIAFQEMENVISSYYDMKEKSVKRYVYSYRKHIGGDVSPKSYTESKVLTKKIRRKRKPKGALGRDDTYNTWIMPDEHGSVKKAISKWGFTPTTETIADVTGLGMGRVRAIIHWMLKKHEIYMTRENLTPTYHNIATSTN